MKRGSDNDLVLEVGKYPSPHNPKGWIGAERAHGELGGGDGMAAAFASPRHAWAFKFDFNKNQIS